MTEADRRGKPVKARRGIRGCCPEPQHSVGKGDGQGSRDDCTQDEKAWVSTGS